jgi:hypothetical protein
MDKQMSVQEEEDIQRFERPRRNKALKKALIAFNHQHSTRPCVLREISETGALLELDDATNLPMNFILHVELDGFKVPCKWIRKIESCIAVQFTEPREPTKLIRKQSVKPSFDRLTMLMEREQELKKIMAQQRAEQASDIEANTKEQYRTPNRVKGITFGKRR